MKKLIYMFLALNLAGCVTYKPIVNKDYKGATSIIADTYEPKSRGSADFYYLASYNGNVAINAINTTNAASQGKGAVIYSRGASRQIKAEKAKLKLVGQVHHSAPIGYLLNSDENYIVSGEIDFTPEASQTYLVKGYLDQAYSAVWLEDISGNIVSEIIEQSGADTALAKEVKQSFFEKRTQAVGRSKIAILSNIKGGETKEIVELKLGKPDSASELESNFFSGRPAKVTYHYDQVGTVTFTKDPTMYVESVSALVQSALSDSSELAYQLKTYDSRKLQNFAKKLFNNKLTDVTSLDMVASRIWLSRESDDSYEIDAISWLCKALGQSQNARYSALLAELGKSAKSSKLKRHALTSFKMLPNQNVEQFDFKKAEI